MKPVPVRNFVLTLALALAASLAVAPAHAGPKEITAINNELLALSKTIQTATDAELSNAVINAIKNNPALNSATIAGEALKGAVVATNIGNVLATDVLAEGAAGLPKIFATTTSLQTFVGKSSATAATGTGANPSKIASFAQVFIGRTGVTDRNAEAIAIAKFSLNSTTAIGEIFQGRVQIGDLTTDTNLALLANNAIIDPKLKKAAQQIAENVGAFATDAGQFAVLTTASNALASLVPIATGVTVAQPNKASEIVDDLFAGNNVSGALFPVTVKNATKLAKSIGLVADAEQVGQVAAQLGARVGLLSAGKVVGIKQTSVNALMQGLVAGLATRSNAAATAVQNGRVNRIDEIGEVGAYLVNAISGLPDFKGKDNAGNDLTGAKLNAAAKRAAGIITGLLKTAVKTALKVHRDIALVPPTNPKVTLTKDAQFQATVADDIAGSVAQTLRSLNQLPGYFNATVFNTIVAALTKTNSLNQPLAGKSIAGGSTTLFDVGDGAKTIAQLVQDALALGLGTSGNPADLIKANTIYEDGTLAALGVSDIVGLETDFRSR